MDFAVLAQAFHHAFDPARLLEELRRVLRPRGVVLVTGEHRIGIARFTWRLLRHVGKQVLSGSIPRVPGWAELFPPDPRLGDHYYSADQYARMFDSHGFRWIRLSKRRWGGVSYVLERRT
jgi:SAM-dependent methyltransferase